MAKAKPLTAELVRDATYEMSQIVEAMTPEPLFRAAPEDLSLATGIAAWAVLSALADAVEERKKQFRQHYMLHTEVNGNETDNGGQRIWVENCEVIREKRQGKTPDEDQLKALLKANDIPVQECFDEVKSLQFNPAKLDYMVDSGRITPESAAAIEKMKRVDWAFKVKPSELVTSTVDHLVNNLLGNPPGTKRLKAKK